MRTATSVQFSVIKSSVIPESCTDRSFGKDIPLLRGLVRLTNADDHDSIERTMSAEV